MDPGIGRIWHVLPGPGEIENLLPGICLVLGNRSHENSSTPSDTDDGIKGAKNYECVCPVRCGGKVCANVHNASRDCFLSIAETFVMIAARNSFSINSGRAPMQSHLFKKITNGICAEVSEL